MGKQRSVEILGLIYARLAKILSFKVCNLQKLASCQVMSFSTNNHVHKSRSGVTSGWSIIRGIENY